MKTPFPISRLLSFSALLLAFGPSQGRADPPAAVVRIASHGASATAIHTAPGRTLLLGCAHAYEGNARAKKMIIDIPASRPVAAKPATIKLLAVDYQADLSLVELSDGPLPNVCPVAPPGHRPGRNVLSVGFDEMKWPAQQRRATLLSSDGLTTFTAERPWHGRSGGALIDLDAGYLIGVVQGYEITGARRGMYVSHQTILHFLARHRPASPRPPPSC